MHKARRPDSMPPFRPIVSSEGTENYELAKYLFSLLQPQTNRQIIARRIVLLLFVKYMIHRFLVISWCLLMLKVCLPTNLLMNVLI